MIGQDLTSITSVMYLDKLKPTQTGETQLFELFAVRVICIFEGFYSLLQVLWFLLLTRFICWIHHLCLDEQPELMKGSLETMQSVISQSDQHVRPQGEWLTLMHNVVWTQGQGQSRSGSAGEAEEDWNFWATSHKNPEVMDLKCIKEKTFQST